MSTALAPAPQALDRDTIAKVLLSGDLEKLTDTQRMAYCQRVCESLGLNPLTQPFAFLKLSGKTVMYAKKDATEQLRKLHGVSITSVTSQRIEDVFVVTANALDREGRADAATGAVTVGSLKGDALANALMKAETKAKRRVTLSICGLGMLDETEAEPLREPEPRTFPLATVLKVEKKTHRGATWADVTFASQAGEEVTLPTAVDTKDAAVSLFEQLEASKELVTLDTDIGKNGKERIAKATRKSTQDAENTVIDAEIAAQDAENRSHL